jgi:glycosyltransferase involved in cell wall biosynthesis
MKIYFWQEFVSPHIAYLINQIASKGVKVNLVVEKIITLDRKKLGWEKLKLPYLKLIIFKSFNDNSFKNFFSKDIIHICQGLLFNGFIKKIQSHLRGKNLKQWILMERVNDRGFKGPFKRIVYSFLFFLWKKKITGILAIGSGSSEWYINRGFDKQKIFPFAYFLNESISLTKSNSINHPLFKFIFVGQLIKRKNVDLLIESLSLLKTKKKFELEIIGNGPLKKDLINKANKILPNKVKWIDNISINKVPKKIADADCLILPSFFDGWGAVVSESLMVGTPVICSEQCGSSEVVKASKFGYIFKNNNIDDLVLKLKKTINKGKVSRKKREVIKNWAKCLSSKSGANYFIKILSYSSNGRKRPLPPWKIKR